MKRSMSQVSRAIFLFLFSGVFAIGVIGCETEGYEGEESEQEGVTETENNEEREEEED